MRTSGVFSTEVLGGQKMSGSFYHCVAAGGDVCAVERDIDVGLDTELDLVAVGIEHRAGREAHAPAVWQFAEERQTGAAASLIAHYCNERASFHVADKSIRSAVTMAVCEHYGPFLPSNALTRLKIFLSR